MKSKLECTFEERVYKSADRLQCLLDPDINWWVLPCTPTVGDPVEHMI